MIKAIIFDFDGVLVDSLELGMEVVNEICRRLGGKTCSDLNQFKKNNLLSWKERFSESGVDPIKTAEAVEIIYQHYNLKNHHKMSLRKNMDTILKKLAEKHTLAIVSHNYKELILKILQKHNLAHLFSEVIGEESPGSKADRINYLMKKFNLNNKEILFIGDMVHDIEAGKQTGVKTLIFEDGWNHKEDLLKHKPDLLINKAEDILEVVEHG